MTFLSCSKYFLRTLVAGFPSSLVRGPTHFQGLAQSLFWSVVEVPSGLLSNGVNLPRELSSLHFKFICLPSQLTQLQRTQTARDTVHKMISDKQIPRCTMSLIKGQRQATFYTYLVVLIIPLELALVNSLAVALTIVLLIANSEKIHFIFSAKKLCDNSHFQYL